MAFTPYNVLYLNDREVGVVRFLNEKHADAVIRYWREVYDNSLRIIPIRLDIHVNNIKIKKCLRRYFNI